MKKILTNSIKILLVLLLVTVGVTFNKGETAFAAESKMNYVKDGSGNVLETGKRYYVAPEFDLRRALTFEVYLNWDYALISNERKNDPKTYGTPIEMYIDGTNEKKGLKISGTDKIIFKMVNHNWAGYKYFNFKSTGGGYVWLDNEPNTLVLEQKNNEKGVALSTGIKTTRYNDKFGRPTGKMFAKTSRTAYSYIYAMNFNPHLDWKEPGKIWLNVQPGFWTITKYQFTPVK